MARTGGESVKGRTIKDWDLIDQERGGWYRILQRDNTRYGPEKPPHGKTDFYHPLGAYLESLNAIGAPLPKKR